MLMFPYVTNRSWGWMELFWKTKTLQWIFEIGQSSILIWINIDVSVNFSQEIYEPENTSNNNKFYIRTTGCTNWFDSLLCIVKVESPWYIKFNIFHKKRTNLYTNVSEMSLFSDDQRSATCGFHISDKIQPTTAKNSNTTVQEQHFKSFNQFTSWFTKNNLCRIIWR